MDTGMDVRAIIKRILRDYAEIKPAYGEVETETIFDDEKGHYEVIRLGWDGHRPGVLGEGPQRRARRREFLPLQWPQRRETPRARFEQQRRRAIPQYQVIRGEPQDRGAARRREKGAVLIRFCSLFSVLVRLPRFVSVVDRSPNRRAVEIGRVAGIQQQELRSAACPAFLERLQL